MLAVVAGSGVDLLPLLDTVQWERPFAEFPGLGVSTVAGHASRFVCGALHARGAETPILLQCGRRHAYEGLPYDAAVRTVDVLQELGATRILFTNAVGGLDATLRPGALVAMTACAAWPFHAYALPERIEPAFVIDGPDAAGLNYFMHGPSYETPAEIAALRTLGAMTVGMSTAPELHRCTQLDIAAGAISVVTNICGAPGKLTHDEVVQHATEASARLRMLIRNFATIP
jgi:purine-nucleoside phosphorylase